MDALKGIDRVVDEALVQADKSPPIWASDLEDAKHAGTKIIAGFSVADEVVETKEIARKKSALRDRILMYLLERDELVANLKKAGVETLATLSLSAWNRICQESGLFRFLPNEKGEVILIKNRYDNPAFDSRDRFNGYAIAGILTVCALAVIATILSCFGPETALGTGLIFTIAGLTASLGFGGDEIIDRVTKYRGRRHISRFLKKPWAEQLHLLLPNGESFSYESYLTTWCTRLLLPTPPNDVKETLLKVTGLQRCSCGCGTRCYRLRTFACDTLETATRAGNRGTAADQE